MKITVVGDAMVITSAVKLEDIKLVEKYEPKVLTLYNEEEEPLFRVTTGKGAGSIDTYGAVFSHETRDDQKLACLSMGIGSEVTDVKKYIAENYGVAFSRLNEIEVKIAESVGKITEMHNAVMESIAVL